MTTDDAFVKVLQAHVLGIVWNNWISNDANIRFISKSWDQVLGLCS